MMSNISLIDGHIDNAEHCVWCGAVIPEGRQVCIICGLKTNYKQSTTDAVEVVRCKDCKYAFHHPLGYIYCHRDGRNAYEMVFRKDSFCSYGERKDKED